MKKVLISISNFFRNLFKKKADVVSGGIGESQPLEPIANNSSDAVDLPVGVDPVAVDQVETPPEEMVVGEPVAAVPVAKANIWYEYHPQTGLPTRDQMMNVLVGFIENGEGTKLKKAYKLIRESHGKNRSPDIDALILRQGGELAEPYCQYGCQESLDDLCAYYKIDRKKVAIPEGGGTQRVYEKTSEKYIRSAYEAMCWITWQLVENPKRGHVGWTLTKGKKDLMKTFEFNTTAKADGVVRDGQGAEYADRSAAGTDSMKVRGYIDVYQAVVDAMDPVIELRPLA